MTKPVAEKKLNIVPGMTVAQVKREGTQAQKEAIILFDYNQDGVIQKDEAKQYNKHAIYKKENTLNIEFNEDCDKKVKLIYEKPEQLKRTTICDGGLSILSTKPNEYEEFANYDGKTTYNYNTKSAVISDMKGGHGTYLFAKNLNNLTVKNSSVGEIHADNTKNINLVNVKEGGLWNSDTTLYMTKGANLRQDKQSMIDVEF